MTWLKSSKQKNAISSASLSSKYSCVISLTAQLMCQWWQNCSQLSITPLCTSYSQQSAQANILKSRCTSVHEQQASKVYTVSGTSCTVVQCSWYAVQTCTGISFCLFLVQVNVSSVVPSFCDFYLLTKLSILLNICVDFFLQLKILMGGKFFLK